MTGPRLDPHQQLLDDARQAAAAAERSQRRLLSEVDDDDATLRGSMEALAEAGAVVALATAGGRRVRGAIQALARDHAVVAGDRRTDWVHLGSVTTLTVPRDGGLRAGGGERTERPAVPLVQALRPLVEDRTEVDVAFDDGTSARGTATALGRDVLTLREPGSGSRILVHLDRVAVVTVRDP